MAGAGTPGWEKYLEVNREINKAMNLEGNDADFISKVFMVADLAATVVDGLASMGNIKLPTSLSTTAIKGGIQSLITGSKISADAPLKNPWFVAHGFGDVPSKYTKDYLKNRAIKGAGATALSFAGSLASTHTLVNVGGAASDLNAVGSTGAHIYKVHAIAKSYKQTFTIARWCDVIIKAKAAKVGVRGMSLAGNLIPVPAASLGVGVATSLARSGVTAHLNNTVYATAAEIHWRAFQEQRISGGLDLGTGGAIGPGSRLFWEIFTRRGFTRMFGKYNIQQLISEPGGWQALGDKLMNL